MSVLFFCPNLISDFNMFIPTASYVSRAAQSICSSCFCAWILVITNDFMALIIMILFTFWLFLSLLALYCIHCIISWSSCSVWITEGTRGGMLWGNLKMHRVQTQVRCLPWRTTSSRILPHLTWQSTTIYKNVSHANGSHGRLAQIVPRDI